MHYNAGDAILCERCMFFLSFGRASIYSRTQGRPMRLASFRPGVVFGELALLPQQPNSTDMIADTDLILEELTPEAYKLLYTENPILAMKLMRSLVMELSIRIRNKTRAICEMES